MPDYIEPYIKVYVWLLQHPELKPLDAIVISQIMQFPTGCWISSNNLRKLFGIHKRTVQKKIVELQKKQWLAVLPEEQSNRRFVWATLKDPPIGPLFDYGEKAEEAMRGLRAKNARYMVKTIAKQFAFKW